MLATPVLRLELLLGGRRGHFHRFRWAYAAWLVGQLLFFGGAAQARQAPALLTYLLVEQLLMVVVATPVLAAGAITEEKERGTLELLLSAGLTPWEILVGKVLGRLALLGLLLLTGLPPLWWAAALCDLALPLLAVLLAQEVVAAFALAAWAVLISVAARRTRDAVLLHGLLCLGTVLGYFLWTATNRPGTAELRYLNPAFVWEPYLTAAVTADVPRRLAWHAGAWLTFGAGCLAAAAVGLRPAYLRQLQAPARSPGSVNPLICRPPVGADPIRWYERHVLGISPLRLFRRIPLGVAVGVVGGTTLGLAAMLVAPGVPWSRADALILLSMLGLAAATHAVAVRASGTVSGEREQQTWDLLLLAPIPTPDLVRAKVWGVLEAAAPVAAAFLVPILVVAGLCGGAMLGVLNFVLLFPGALYFAAATGVRHSVTARTSWQGLLWTLGSVYLSGLGIYLTCIILVGCLLGLVVPLHVQLRSSLGQLAWTVTYQCTFNLGFLWAAQGHLAAAAKHIDTLDRPSERPATGG